MIINRFNTDSALSYQKFIEENGSKNFDFWSDLVEKGNLTVSHLHSGEKNYVIQKKDFSGSIRNIKKVLDSLEKDWAFLFQTTETEELILKGFVIYYPFIIVCNEYEGSEHYFKDAFVKYSLTYNYEVDKVRIQKFSLTRTTFNELEIIEKDYPEDRLIIHPHMGSCSLNNSTKNFESLSIPFCVGEDDGGLFSNTLIFRDQEEPEAIEYIIHFVEDFISQEDSDGGPYYHIHNFMNRPSQEFDYRGLNTFTSLVSYLPSKINTLLKNEEVIKIVSNILNNSGFNYQGEEVTINPNNFNYYFSELLEWIINSEELVNKFLTADVRRLVKTSKEDYLEYLESVEIEEQTGNEIIEKPSKSFYFEKRLFTPKIVRESLDKDSTLQINMNNFTFPEKEFKRILINKLQDYVDKVVQEHDNKAPEIYSKF